MPVAKTLTINDIKYTISDGDALKRSGGNMSGDINMAVHKITNVAQPTNNGDVVNLGYARGAFAPIGYGTRAFDEFIPPDADFNNYIDGGIHGVNSNDAASKIANCPIGTAGRLEVIVSAAVNDATWPNKYRRQVYETLDGYRICRRFNSADNGTTWTFDPWEWENPPFYVIGQPYRTTERHNGKAVYAMRVNLGVVTLGQNSITWNDYANNVTPIRYNARFLAQTLPKYDSEGKCACDVFISGNTAVVHCTQAWIVETGGSIEMTVYYTI